MSMKETSGGIWVPDSVEAEEKRDRIERKTSAGHALNTGTLESAMAEFEAIQQAKGEKPEHGVLYSRVSVPMDKVEKTLAFWKPIYFDVTKEGRHLNGIEAYELGDPKISPRPSQAPYIAMCNIMALEALRRMGDDNPTRLDARVLGSGSEKEKDIAAFWKDTFHPTAFQAEWAWKAAMAVMAGDPAASREMFDNYRGQLP